MKKIGTALMIMGLGALGLFLYSKKTSSANTANTPKNNIIPITTPDITPVQYSPQNRETITKENYIPSKILRNIDNTPIIATQPQLDIINTNKKDNPDAVPFDSNYDSLESGTKVIYPNGNIVYKP